MYIHCCRCHESTWIRSLVPGLGEPSIECQDCGHEHDLSRSSELGETGKEQYDLASEFASGNGVDLPTAYSVLLGLMTLQEARDAATKQKERQREKAAELSRKHRQLLDAELEAQRENRKEDVDFVGASRFAADIHTTAGRIYVARGRPQSAKEHWQRAAFLDEKNAECRKLLSDSYMRQQRWSDVLDLQRELLEVYPDSAVYHLNEGVALFYLGKPDESEQALRQGIRLAPEFVRGYHDLLQVLMYGDRKLPEAKAVAEKLVELEPTARNYTILSGLCRKTGDEAGARAARERALQLDPGSR